MSLDLIRELASQDNWLAVLVTRRPNGTPAVSIVNAGVLDHPVTGGPTVAFVARGGTAKLGYLREDPHATLVFKAGWEWVAVEGPTELAGPDDHLAGLPQHGLRTLLRDIYHAAGGQHDDLDAYDRAMAAERRTAVLLDPRPLHHEPTRHRTRGPRMTPRPATAPGTIQLWSDLLCPFAYVAIHRLLQTRDRLGLDVRIDHHTFALELFDGPHKRPGTDSEAVGLGQLAPEIGWRLWSRPDWEYPHTVLLAAEAVHAAKEQGHRQAEDLDRALRKAFWLESRSIAHRQVILEVADETTTVDTDQLADALDRGTHRRRIAEDHAVARTDTIKGSPHLFLPDGTDAHNPGIDVRWEGPFAAGYPIAAAKDDGWAERLLHLAAR